MARLSDELLAQLIEVLTFLKDGGSASVQVTNGQIIELLKELQEFRNKDRVHVPRCPDCLIGLMDGTNVCTRCGYAGRK